MTISLLAMYDDYTRKVHALVQNDCTKEFLAFVRNQQQCRIQWKEAVDECQRLKSSLDKSESLNSDLEKKLTRARMILHEEKERANAAEAAKDAMEERLSQMLRVLESILHAGGELANDTKLQLDRLMSSTNVKLRYSGGGHDSLYPKLDPIDEINSTGDLLSDVSVSRSDDTMSLDTSDRMTRVKKPRRSDVLLDEVPTKRRRSARLSACGLKTTGRDQLVATTTVTVPAYGAITAKSRIETRPVDSETFQVPSAPPLPISSSSDSEAPPTPRVDHFNRPHNFDKATVLKPEECCACSKTMSFASKMFKCGECKAVSHPECREGVPVPCMPTVATPRGERTLRLVDLVGPSLPLVPPIVVRCVMEVERRGLAELGLYRVPGSEKDVRSLRTKFQRGKSTISLSGYDIHVVCGVLKDFLRSLPDPVITRSQWSGFVDAVKETSQDSPAALYQQVAELPPAHRDTLAFIMMHLLRVAQSPPCKMTISNLAKVFGPTLIGCSTAAPTHQEFCDQSPLLIKVVEGLLDLGEDYWRNVMQKPSASRTPLLTPKYSMRRRNMGKSTKLFNTPPAK